MIRYLINKPERTCSSVDQHWSDRAPICLYRWPPHTRRNLSDFGNLRSWSWCCIGHPVQSASSDHHGLGRWCHHTGIPCLLLRQQLGRRLVWESHPTPDLLKQLLKVYFILFTLCKWIVIVVKIIFSWGHHT